MCAQFLQSQSSDDVRRAKGEMKQHWSASFDAGASFSILNIYRANEMLTLDLRFLLPPSSDMDDVLEDDFAREIIVFHVDMVPANSSGKGS
jgi:hypothetical protein